MITKFLVFSALFACLWFSAAASAQGEEKFTLSAGISADELTAQLGKPDERSGDPSSEKWKYGSSLVFLRDGKVTAWSDTGNLASRRTGRANFKRKQERRVNDWAKAWEPQESLSRDKAIDSVLDIDR
jgi:hypothetical protein